MIISWPVRLALYASVVTFMSSYYDSWSTTMGLLIRLGVYEDACTPEEVAAGQWHLAKCDAQITRLGGLLSVFRIAEFVTSMGVGVFMDLVGPKVCVVAGILVRSVSWLILSLFANVNWAMIAACILAGVTTNAIAFPVYTIGRYWPAYQDIAMCVISVSLSAGCFYTLIVNLVLDQMPDVNLRTFVILKLLITHLPWLVTSSLIFPNNIVADINKNMTATMSRKNRELNLEETVSEAAPWNFKCFLSYVFDPEIMVVTGVFIVNCISLTFAQESFTQVYINNKAAESFNSVMLPLSSAFAFIFMWVINKFGVMVVIFGLNIVSAAMHAFLLSTSTTSSIFASICISVTFSGFITFFFICLERLVDIGYSGSMKGYLTTAAGVSLAINPALNLLIGSYDVMKGCQSFFIGVRLAMIVPLYWLLRKESARRRPPPDIVDSAA